MTRRVDGRAGRLAGHVALVTGAARNIGAAVVERLAADGAAVAVNHRGIAGDGDAVALADRVRSRGGMAETFVADVGDEAQVHGMVTEVTRRLGPPSILVNNAAASVVGATPWTDLAIRDWDEVLRINVTGAFICARAVVEGMRARGGGRIIQMSSVRVTMGRAGNAHYTSSKAALIGMTRVLARELGPDRITVNTIMVGAIRTAAESAYGDPAELDRVILASQAIQRRGIPADIAGVVAFLASDDASFVTGQAITVDGGWVMQ